MGGGGRQQQQAVTVDARVTLANGAAAGPEVKPAAPVSSSGTSTRRTLRSGRVVG